MMENGEENPTFSAAAAWLVSKLSGALRATKELQDMEEPPLSLEDSVLKSLTTGGTVFLNQKRLFDMLPGPILAMISSECGVRWRQPPLVLLLVNDRTRHLILYLTKPSYASYSSFETMRGEDGEGWTLQDVELLCRKIAQESRNSLRSLDITIKPPWADWREKRKAEEARTTGQSDLTAPQSLAPGDPGQRPPETHPGVTAAQLCALLQEVRGLVKLNLQGDFKEQEIVSIVSTLADTNPGIRELRIPRFSKESLIKIADVWPELEVLDMGYTPGLSSSDLAAVLPRFKNLQHFPMSQSYYDIQKTRAMIEVSRHHDPSTPPYKLNSTLRCSDIPDISGEILGKLFDAFPAISVLEMFYKHIPAVCAGLEGRSNIRITKVNLVISYSNNQPRLMEPLLALQGKNLRELQVDTDADGGDDVNGDSVDVSMIGHYCPNLQVLNLFAERFVAGDQYKVTPYYFSKLKKFSLSLNTIGIPVHLPDPLVFRLLASPHLERFANFDVVISEWVMASLATESGEQPLSSLEEVTMYPNSASVEVLATLLSLAPRLRELRVQCFDEMEEREKLGVITAFLRQTGLKANLDSSMW